jgi:hypothetical protein
MSVTLTVPGVAHASGVRSVVVTLGLIHFICLRLLRGAVF